MKDAPNAVIIAFARLPFGKWEKVPKGDEGTFSPDIITLGIIDS
jgi:hypothetical protein